MKRRCTGEDPNLEMRIDPETGERVTGRVGDGRTVEKRPCDCGLVFDDVRRSTIYPHEEI